MWRKTWGCGSTQAPRSSSVVRRFHLPSRRLNKDSPLSGLGDFGIWVCQCTCKYPKTVCHKSSSSNCQSLEFCLVKEILAKLFSICPVLAGKRVSECIIRLHFPCGRLVVTQQSSPWEHGCESLSGAGIEIKSLPHRMNKNTWILSLQ